MSAPDPKLPDQNLIVRFRRDVAAVLGRAPAADECIALAVSGGPDSMAMLALAAAAFPGHAIAATVDHGLRPESADEAAMVAAYCAEAGIPHATLRVVAPPDVGDNIQAWARQERYALLRRWAVDAGAATLATAHHADDQAETFLMRAARGAGLSGLAAVRARQDGAPTLIRPLLEWRHHELVAIATAASLPFIDDPSNADVRFDRTRFRRLLADAPWIDPMQIGRSAANLAAVDADLLAISQWLWKERARSSPESEAKIDIAGLPRAIRRYLARMAIEHVLTMGGIGEGGWPHATNIESLLDALESGKGATQGQVMASAKGEIWHFREAPPRRSH